MKLNNKTRYTIELLVYLNNEMHNDNVNVFQIAQELDIPISNLRKIIVMLTKLGYVNSKRGVNGGITLAKEPIDISFYKIFLETENINFKDLCLVDCRKCRDKKYCKFGSVVQRKYADFILSFRDISLHDIIEGGL